MISVKVDGWAVLALLVSWHLGNSFGWVVLHTILGWQYLVYAALTSITGMPWVLAIVFVLIVGGSYEVKPITEKEG